MVVLLATPALIKVAFLKRLFDEPGERKLHKRMVPTIGGIIIFAGALFAYALWFPSDMLTEYGKVMGSIKDFKFIVATLLILFFVGVKDDIIGTAPIKKLAAHVIVGLVLVLMADIRIKSMHGLFGIHENLPHWASVFLSLFTYIVVVNAFNLIDGVDGLAGGVGVICSATFGVGFFLGGDLVMATLCFSLVGALMAFLIFNFSPAKIFMGDSGSLSIGLLVCVMAIKFVEFDRLAVDAAYLPFYSPVFVMAVLFYPLVDTLRIFIYRTSRGLSPFSADRNHMHHQLIDSGFSHRWTVIAIYVANLFIIGLAWILDGLSGTWSFIIVGISATILSQIPYLLKKQHLRKKGDPAERSLNTDAA
ncbi:MAG: UDP-N-acetylmuramyl pentapeptide phosphotransferase/UDP-N-acetylglucosamine-1-phosphate transferase [Bacteroidetes bacterium]|nr:MAG: UDP-N-acetylmuramyl pentapeptide phosphotransferase/UDP-N-acetylglucosamine-1-phosphate transferase [Bacteroidota bacterium]